MNRIFIIYLFTFFLIPLSISAQQQEVLTAADYARAEQMMNYKTFPLVDRASVRPNWLTSGSFWYSVQTASGREYVLFDPVKKNRKSADQLDKLIEGVIPDDDKIPYEWVRSPDGKMAAYIKDWNLWVKNLATNQKTQLTTDGIKDFGYATDNAGWTHSDRAILVWSPDSKKIATFKQDQRHLNDMYLVTTNVGSPKLKAWKYPLPGDKEIAKLHRVIIDVENVKTIKLQMDADEHRSSLCDDIACDGSWTDVEWSADSKTLAFLSTSRDHKEEKLRIADASTGLVRQVYEESTNTQFESGQGEANWRYLPETNEFIWFTEREGWGHLYLYDLTTGKLKNPITSGQWAVWRILKVDRKARKIYFIAGGREEGRDPYFGHFYSVEFNGKNLKLLTPEEGNHRISFSEDGKYFVDNYSQPDVPNVAVLRDMNGKLIAELEKADISRLKATGWKPPTPIQVKSRDGKYDLYGLMFTPTNLDESKKYPIINYIYPGPQGGSVGPRYFYPSRRDHQALAELGFVVVAIDGTCNPLRSKVFHDECYGNMADNTLPDQIEGMKQLAKKYPYIDLDRVGIWGHSGGGFATAAAMFRFPDFFKVGISESGNHDNRNYEDDWGERYIGLLVPGENSTSNYEAQANQLYAKNLKGKLLLAHGGMDDNVPPYNTYLVVEALIEANKDFDLIILPSQRHGFRGQSGLYMTRRRWDYFVEHLLGAKPPKEYQLRSK